MRIDLTQFVPIFMSISRIQIARYGSLMAFIRLCAG